MAAEVASVAKPIHGELELQPGKHALVLGTFGTHTAVVALCIFVTSMMPRRFPVNPNPGPSWHVTTLPWVTGLIRWDAAYYLSLAEFGYVHKMLAAFFPFYPFLIRALATVMSWVHGPFHFIGNFQPQFTWAGFLISNGCLLGAMYLLYAVVAKDYSASVATRTVLYLGFFPTSFFFSTVYTESTFLFLTCLTFYFAQKQMWVSAAIVAGLAALTRNTGFLLVLSLWVLLWKFARYNDLSRRALVMRGALIGFIPATIFSIYPFFLFRRFHNPLLFMSVERDWHRHFSFPWNWFWTALTKYPTDCIPAVMFVLIVIVSWKRLRLEHWLFLTLGLAISLSAPVDGDPKSILRYELVLFPALIYLATILKTRRLHVFYLAMSTGIMVELTILFSTWYFVG